MFVEYHSEPPLMHYRDDPLNQEFANPRKSFKSIINRKKR